MLKLEWTYLLTSWMWVVQEIKSRMIFFFWPKQLEGKTWHFLRAQQNWREFYEPRSPAIFLCLFCLYFLHSFLILSVLGFTLTIHQSALCINSSYSFKFNLDLLPLGSFLWTSPFEVRCVFLSPYSFIYVSFNYMSNFLVLYYLYNFWTSVK